MQALLLCGLLLGLTAVAEAQEAQEVDGAQSDDPYVAFGPGDVFIGILLPCHGKVKALGDRLKPDSYNCSDFDLQAFIKALAIIHEIEKINEANYIPGLRLGYVMLDTCSYASKALQSVGQLLGIQACGSAGGNLTTFRPNVKAILGARYSETSVAVARLLNVYMVPLLSSTSSSPELSDKERYPVFMRTIPSDVHQTKALVKLMEYYHWNWVGVIYGDDEYGKAALESFLRDAEEHSVCLAYQAILPHYLDHPNIDQLVEQVAKQIRSTEAQVVLLIIKGELVELIFKEMIKTKTTRTWIASDVWSRNLILSQMEGINKVGDILGFSFMTGKSDSFSEYLKNPQPTPGGYNHFLNDFKKELFNCSLECYSNQPPPYCPLDELDKMPSDHSCNFNTTQDPSGDPLTSSVDTGATYLHRVSVWSVANALKKLLVCNSSFCQRDSSFPPWELLMEMRKVEFSFDNVDFHFDNFGDFVTGYELNMWEKHGRRRQFRRVGKYQVLDGEVILDDEDFPWYSNENMTVPQSRCSKRCDRGSHRKILNVSCCYNCIECLEGFYSDETDLDECKKCLNDTWALSGWERCEARTEMYLKWSDAHPIVIIAAGAFGILLLLVILIIFCVHRNSAAMLLAEVRLSCVMMAGLAVSFVSVLCFWGRPNVHLCRARQILYAMGFTLCVACVLVKAYRTFLEFLPIGPTRRRLHKLYKPLVIVILTTIAQGLICLLWFILDSPDVEASDQSMDKKLKCTEGKTYIGFGIMLSYIALLVLVCFVLAFKGRKIPKQFSETGQIIFSMLMYLFVWVCFIPVYITREEEATLLQASAVLVSNYGIICCHFVPQCYDALRGSRNTQQASPSRRSSTSF